MPATTIPTTGNHDPNTGDHDPHYRQVGIFDQIPDPFM
jgi:hypothetical protein